MRYHFHSVSTTMIFQIISRRLHGLLKRLQQNPEILREYDAIIRNQLERGIVEEVGDSEVTDSLSATSCSDPP